MPSPCLEVTLTRGHFYALDIASTQSRAGRREKVTNWTWHEKLHSATSILTHVYVPYSHILYTFFLYVRSFSWLITQSLYGKVTKKGGFWSTLPLVQSWEVLLSRLPFFWFKQAEGSRVASRRSLCLSNKAAAPAPSKLLFTTLKRITIAEGGDQGSFFFLLRSRPLKRDLLPSIVPFSIFPPGNIKVLFRPWKVGGISLRLSESKGFYGGAKIWQYKMRTSWKYWTTKSYANNNCARNSAMFVRSTPVKCVA